MIAAGRLGSASAKATAIRSYVGLHVADPLHGRAVVEVLPVAGHDVLRQVARRRVVGPLEVVPDTVAPYGEQLPPCHTPAP